MHNKLSKLLPFCSQRAGNNLRILGIGIVCMISFGGLIARFYKLQIIEYETYAENVRASTQRTIETTAQRGEVYDRYGEPLAVNQTTNNLYYTSNIKLSDKQLNTLLLQLIDLLEKNGDTLVDEVPISLNEPFEYTEDQTSLNQYTYQIPYTNEAERKVLLTYTAEELINYLKEAFQIPSNLKATKVRQLIALRSPIYSSSYKQYEDVVLARNLSDQTISFLKENDESLPNLVVYTKPERYYPLGSITSNILGYTKPLTGSQYKALKDKGYGLSDVMGQVGIEKSLEEKLRGINGTRTIEVDNMGREICTISETESVKGQDVYLTIDASLQKDIYQAVASRLSEALIYKLESTDTYNLSGKDLLISLVTCHGLDLDFQGEQTLYLNKIKQRLQKAYNEIDPLMRTKVKEEELLVDWLNDASNEDEVIHEVILALAEQGVLQLNEETVKQLEEEGTLDLTQLFINQLEEGVITPGQMAIDPFSVVAAMVDVKSGEVLSLVDYPSYDNNKMVQGFNDYWNEVSNDARSLLWQRSLKTLKAPGSTFKMLTALAGLEEGCITKDTIIEDTGIYKEAGKPYPKCWYYTNYGVGHGPLNLVDAIGMSCNYYFYEVAHRLGNTSDGIVLLSKYMKKLGLTEKTGIELEEEMPCASIPEVVVTTKISGLINNLAQLDETTKRQYVEQDIINLRKQLQIGEEELTSSEEVNKAYEESLNEDLVPVIQEILEAEDEALLNEVYTSLSQYIGSERSAISERCISEILGEEDLTKRAEKANAVFLNIIDEATGKNLDIALNESLSKISSDTLLDAYEKALTKAYRKMIRMSDKSEEVNRLNETIKSLNRQENELREKLLLKLRQKLLNIIVSNLLNGVELDWTEGITVRTAIGQGYNAFSPLQVLRYVAALGNGETLESLKVVKNETAKKGEPLGIASSNIQAVQEGMLSVTVGEKGTAKGQFDNLPMQVAAKTGTAEEGSHEHSYIVAFAPYEKPEVVLIVAIYNADGLGRYSSLIANDMLLSYFGLQNKQESITLANTWME